MVTRAVQARRDGATWARAAEAGGYNDRSACHKAVTAFLRANAIETVEEYRQLFLLRYERLILNLMPRALGSPSATPPIPGDLDAAIEVRRLTAEMSRLVGANAPTKVEVTSELDEEIKALAVELGMLDTDITSTEVGEEV
jgi:hypothetical protein